PATPQEREAWKQTGAQSATAAYGHYLEQRQAGAPRRYFSNRAHALYFLRAVAPTKLVDGAWLYGLLKHWRNPRFADLLRTYVEELGDGAADKNHVVIYRALMARYGLESLDGLDDELYTQGVIQLALACSAEDYLPEVIGFNLGYEQLPLHLLISAYELNELGLDPYYFQLHVTVDNPDTGHAKRAVQAVLDNLPRLGDADDFWRRVRQGYQLSNAGVGSTDVIAGFDIEREVVRIFSHKSAAGHGAHSDYCRVAGRNINDWLARKEDIPEFLGALQKAGWIRRGAPVEESRFWGLLQGARAEMFGVFSPYELQLIHDWIRGDASQDGRAYTEAVGDTHTARRPSFRVAARLAATRGLSTFDVAGANDAQDLLDVDLQALSQQLATLDAAGQGRLLVQAMAPGQHWTPAGLLATRMFMQQASF
ncbi:MAG: iron-containing redox enzyme family protein, partial [Polaromonas sp.]|uniref:iron-containing redox enzyme family protein n=1 Tax=Polaromonas sp. TaxID=1869339 RepID=UPI004035D88F